MEITSVSISKNKISLTLFVKYPRISLKKIPFSPRLTRGFCWLFCPPPPLFIPPPFFFFFFFFPPPPPPPPSPPPPPPPFPPPPPPPSPPPPPPPLSPPPPPPLLPPPPPPPLPPPPPPPFSPPPPPPLFFFFFFFFSNFITENKNTLCLNFFYSVHFFFANRCSSFLCVGLFSRYIITKKKSSTSWKNLFRKKVTNFHHIYNERRVNFQRNSDA
uniref:Uncharacterized protein n=1 Tax=Cacopsylla melanoneura TaxID=428564 RepID=A0A8D8QBC8_9HEMI